MVQRTAFGSASTGGSITKGWYDRRKITFDVDPVTPCQKGDLMPYCGAVSAQSHEEPRPAPARPVAVEMGELLKLVVMETTPGFSDRPDRGDCVCG